MKITVKEQKVTEKELQLPYFFKDPCSYWAILTEEKFIQVYNNAAAFNESSVRICNVPFFYNNVADGEQITEEQFWDVYGDVLGRIQEQRAILNDVA